MEELLLALFVSILELIGEFLTEASSELLASLLWRGLRKGFRGLRGWSSGSAGFDRLLLVTVCLALGTIVGFVSVPIHPYPIFHTGKVHGISLLVSPLLTGLVMAAIGWRLKRGNIRPVPLESFWGGFAFALGMAVIRFLNAR